MVWGMRRLMFIGLIGLLGCSRPVAPPGADLAQAIADRTAGPPQSCVQIESSSNLHAIDEARISATVPGGRSTSTIWPGPVPGSGI